MAEIATSDFLSRLKDLYLSASSKDQSHSISREIDNPWYLVTAVAFSAGNRPEEVACVFKFVIAVLTALSASEDDKRRVVVRMREALFKAGLFSGYSRAISALIALYEVTPSELRDTTLVRELGTDKFTDMLARGDEFFAALHGDKTEAIMSLFTSVHPDMGWFARAIGCGYVFGAQKILAQRETSFVLVAALVAMDTPQQTKWHLANARRAGASDGEINAVREIAIQVASACGVKWRDGVPELKDEI